VLDTPHSVRERGARGLQSEELGANAFVLHVALGTRALLQRMKLAVFAQSKVPQRGDMANAS
jgi:hypothetical protein